MIPLLYPAELRRQASRFYPTCRPGRPRAIPRTAPGSRPDGDDRPLGSWPADPGRGAAGAGRKAGRARRRLHPRERAGGDEGCRAAPAADGAGGRSLARAGGEPGRPRVRDARERARGRPEPELPVAVEAVRRARRRVLGDAAAVRARDARRAGADPAHPAAADALVPPAAVGRARVGAERARGAQVRAARVDALPRSAVAERLRRELAEPPLPGGSVVRGRAAARAAGAGPGAAAGARGAQPGANDLAGGDVAVAPVPADA